MLNLKHKTFKYVATQYKKHFGHTEYELQHIKNRIKKKVKLLLSFPL